MTIRLCERTGADGSGKPLPLLVAQPHMSTSYVLNLASVFSGKLCTSVDVMDGDDYLVTYCGGSPYWWLPGTDGRGMHQISSRGWCHDCHDGYVHHLDRRIEVAVLTSEALHDRALRERLEAQGRTAEEYAEETAGNALPL